MLLNHTEKAPVVLRIKTDIVTSRFAVAVSHASHA